MKKTLFIIILLGTIMNCLAQEAQPETDEMKLKLNETGTHYLKWTFSNQVWVRFNQSNPGSTVLSAHAPETFDIGLRRTRVQFFGQLTDHVFFYSQFGQNNFNYLSQNAGNRKLQVFFHDALGEYKVWKKNNILKLGAGLTIANGLSRFSQPGVSGIMTMDVPVFAQATVDQTDEFSRKLSIYARGQLSKLDYRLILSDPFPVTTNGQPAAPLNQYASFAQTGHHKQIQGLFIYNLLEKEPHTTPYMAGTYLGKKKILNIEAGFISQPKATWTKATSDSDSVFHDMTLWSTAIFFDAPIDNHNGSAISVYGGYYNYDFGDGYLRYNGAMNPASGIIGGPAAGSQGNSFPMFGTGEIIYAQAGFLFGKNLLNEKGRLMPYASLMSANFDRIDGYMNVWSIGANWLIHDHNSKITLDYQNRPTYVTVGNQLKQDAHKGQVVLQYQIFF